MKLKNYVFVLLYFLLVAHTNKSFSIPIDDPDTDTPGDDDDNDAAGDPDPDSSEGHGGHDEDEDGDADYDAFLSEEREWLVLSERDFSADAYIDKHFVNKKCNFTKISSRCWASDMIAPVCGSDRRTYLNTGVMKCASRCDPLGLVCITSFLGVSPPICTTAIYVTGMGKCRGDPRPSPRTPAPPSPPTPPPHQSGWMRIRIKGAIHRFAKALGLHTHADGGIYLADEKEHDSWWNI